MLLQKSSQKSQGKERKNAWKVLIKTPEENETNQEPQMKV